MVKDINLSQLLALIEVSGNVKQIKMTGGDLTWRKWKDIDVTKNSHTITIGWKRSNFRGSENQYLCMTLKNLRKPYAWESHKDNRFYEPILSAYYYEGDNCNKNTKFLWEIIGNSIEIIDDIGLVGNGGEYQRKNLLKINSHEIFRMKVNDLGRWSENNG